MVYKKPVGQIPKDFSRETFVESIPQSSFSDVPSREELQSIIAKANPQLPSSGFSIPQFSTAPEDLAKTQTMFDAIQPQQQSGGGFWGDIGGLALKSLMLLDLPRSAIASTIQETVDLFQGEGFSGSDWLRQTSEHHGFGDIIADLNIDLGLGGWGNRIVGFAGDVATDPLAWMGGLSVLARARGVKGLADTMGRRLSMLSDRGGQGLLSAAEKIERSALETGLKALGTNKTVSAVRNSLKKTEGGQELIEKLGIETGLKIRMPGTGPILGRISRSGAFVETAARRRAAQIPTMIQQDVSRKVGKEKFFDFVVQSSRGEVLDETVPSYIQQLARQVSRTPIEFSFKWGAKGKPVLGNFFGSMQALPGSMWNKTALSTFGRAMNTKFGTDIGNFSNEMIRTGDPQKVTVGFFFKDAANRRATISALYASAGERAQAEFQNRIVTLFGSAMKDDNLVKRIISEVNSDHVAFFLNGQMDQIGQGWLNRMAQEFPGQSIEDLIAIRTLYDDLLHGVNGKIREFILRPDLYGSDPELRAIMDDVVRGEGGYNPHTANRDPVGGKENAHDLLKEIHPQEIVTPGGKIPIEVPSIAQLLDPEAPFARVRERGVTYMSEATDRMQSRQFMERTWRVPYINSKNEFVPVEPIWIRNKNVPESKLYHEVIDEETGELVWRRNQEHWVVLSLRRPSPQRLAPDDPAWTMKEGTLDQPARGARGGGSGARAPAHTYKEHLTPHPEGWSVEKQIDDAYRRAGWIKEDDSLFSTSFAAQENGYLSSTNRDISLRAIEVFAEDRGLLFNFRDFDSYFAAMEKIDDLGRRIGTKLKDANANKQAALRAIAALENKKGSAWNTETIEHLKKWIQQGGEELDSLMNRRDSMSELFVKIISANGEIGKTIDELSDAALQIEAKLAELGLWTPDTNFAESAWRFAEDFDAPRAGRAYSGDPKVVSRKRAQFESVRYLLPILEELQPYLKRASQVQEAVDNINVIVNTLLEGQDAMAQRAGAEFIQQYLTPLQESLNYLSTNVTRRLSDGMQQIMDADPTVQGFKALRGMMNRADSVILPERMFASLDDVLNSLSERTTLPTVAADRTRFFSSSGPVASKARQAKSLGQWFEQNRYNLPKNLDEVDFINKFKGHPHEKQLLRITKEYLDILKKNPDAEIYIDFRMADDGHGILDWGFVKTGESVRPSSPVAERIRISKIVAEWMSHTALVDADMASIPVRASVSYAQELLEETPQVARMLSNRWQYYGKSGFRVKMDIPESVVLEDGSILPAGQLDLPMDENSLNWFITNQNNLRMAGPDFESAMIVREPTPAGAVINSQGGLIKVVDGKVVPDVIRVSPYLTRLDEGIGSAGRTAYNKLYQSMSDYGELITLMRKLQQELSTENLINVKPETIVPLMNKLSRDVSDTMRIYEGVVSDSGLSIPARALEKPSTFETTLTGFLSTNPDASLEDTRKAIQQILGARQQTGEVPLEELVSLNALINNYDKISKTAGGQQASIVANGLEAKRLREKIGVLNRNIQKTEQKIASHQATLSKKEAEVLKQEQMIQTMEAEVLSLEAAQVRLQNLAMRENQRAAAILGRKVDGSPFHINSFGGDVNLSKITPETLQDMFKDSGYRLWGDWRVGGDETAWKDFTALMLAAQKMNDRAEVTGFLKVYDRVHNFLKAQMVATPGFVNRNIMGGMFNMFVEDLPISTLPVYGRMVQKGLKEGNGDLAIGLRSLSNADPKNQRLRFAADLADKGAHSGGQAAASVEANLRLDRKLQYILGTKEGTQKGFRLNLNPFDAGFVLYSSVRHANTYAEEMMRLATGVEAMIKGANVDDALETIYRIHFNYGDLSNWEINWAKRFFPFYTWSRKNLPFQIQQIVKNPKRYNRLLSIKRNLEHDEEREGVVPDYFMKPLGFQLPFSVGGSQVYSVPDIPFQDLLRFDPTAEGFDDTLGHVLSSLTPVLKVPAEYWAGRQFFKNIPYTGRYQQVPAAMNIPGLLPALGAIGWAEKNSKGEWRMTDRNIAVVDGMMPYIGRLRRMIPNETRYQERYIQTLVSTLGGLNFRINTPYEQNQVRIRDQIRRGISERDREDLERRIR